jgi:hypothetical protein
MAMDSDDSPRRRSADTNERKDGGWFATFSILDLSGAVSSSDLRRLVAMVSKLWCGTIGRLTDRLGLRARAL